MKLKFLRTSKLRYIEKAKVYIQKQNNFECIFHFAVKTFKNPNHFNTHYTLWKDIKLKLN